MFAIPACKTVEFSRTMPLRLFISFSRLCKSRSDALVLLHCDRVIGCCGCCFCGGCNRLMCLSVISPMMAGPPISFIFSLKND